VIAEARYGDAGKGPFANNWDAKLDVYTPSEAAGPLPTLLYIHGGGWVRGNKESNVLRLLPYLEMGWAVVNVGYRLGEVSLAPAAVPFVPTYVRQGDPLSLM